MSEVWTWWCQEDLFGKHPKKTICLHVQRGRQEYEARYDIAIDYYRDNIRHVEIPKRKRDVLDVLYPETTETWPKVMRFVEEITAYAREKHGLISSHPTRPSTARVSARDEPRIDPDRELPSEVRKEP